jgi:FAD/FMN-containing dehydrogenase
MTDGELRGVTASEPEVCGPRLKDRLRAVVGPEHVLTDGDVVASYLTDWTGRFSGPAMAVVRPGSTAEVAALLPLCAEHGVPVVVQGGNTGLVGGSVPPPSSSGGTLPVVLSTLRLAEIGPVDEAAQQVTVGAGATLGSVQDAVARHGLAVAVDLAARDSATIGGMVACNAGGLHVLRYGTMRQQVLGVEAVLADGRILSRLSGLVKDNTGYDLSQLLVGSEGTLAVITAVRLRLVPRMPRRVVGLFGLNSVDAAVALAAQLRHRCTGLTAAELVTEDGVDLVCRHRQLEPPLARRYPAWLLVEVAGRHDPAVDLADALGDTVDDEATAVAEDDAAAARLWTYREAHTEAIAALGVPHKLDVTVPIEQLATFDAAVRATVRAVDPDAVTVIFGHVGDGNLHVNVVGPDPDDDRVDGAVLELVAQFGGSISAEHGIGRAKVPWLHLSRSPAELAAMGALKAALDPRGLLNPGVLLPAPGMGSDSRNRP